MLHDSVIRNPVDLTLEYSRPLRSLRLWMAFRTHGAAAFRDLDRGHAGARAPARPTRREASPDFELLYEPTLSTVCFRHAPDGVGRPRRPQPALAAADAARRAGLPRARQSSTAASCLRVCFVNFRTRPEDVEFAVEILRELGSRLGRGEPHRHPLDPVEEVGLQPLRLAGELERGDAV